MSGKYLPKVYSDQVSLMVLNEYILSLPLSLLCSHTHCGPSLSYVSALLDHVRCVAKPVVENAGNGAGREPQGES